MSRSTFVHTTFVQGLAGLYFYFPNVLWLGGEVGLPIHGYIHGLLDLCFHSNPRIDPRIDPCFFRTEGGRSKLRPSSEEEHKRRRRSRCGRGSVEGEMRKRICGRGNVQEEMCKTHVVLKNEVVCSKVQSKV